MLRSSSSCQRARAPGCFLRWYGCNLSMRAATRGSTPASFCGAMSRYLRSLLRIGKSRVLGDLVGQRRARVALGKGADEVVKCGPELADARANKDAQLGRDGLHVHGPEEYAAATRIELSLSGVRMWLVRKAVHHRLYGLEVFPCLSDADLDTGEGAIR